MKFNRMTKYSLVVMNFVELDWTGYETLAYLSVWLLKVASQRHIEMVAHTKAYLKSGHP